MSSHSSDNPDRRDGNAGVADGNSRTASPVKEIPRGEGQWSIVWRQFRKRKLAVASAVVIWLLISVSIWAPFIANDRPLMYVGYNRQAYRETSRTARIMLGQFIDRKWKSSDTSWNEWQRSRMEILLLQAELMSQQLDGDDVERLRNLQAEFLRAVSVDDPDDVDVEALRRLQADLREYLDASKVRLVSRQYSPVIRSLSGLEVGFILWNLTTTLLIVWLLVKSYWKIKGTLGTTGLQAMLLTVIFPVVASLLWYWLVPVILDRTNYKGGVFAADSNETAKAPVVYEGVIWPPISYSLDEDHLKRKLARPYFMGPAEATESSETSLVRDETLGPWDTPHWLGADEIGRDILTRMIWGGRVSLSVGIVAVSIYVSIGIIVGALAGYFRGTADMLISRVIEVVICFPSFFLILSIVSFLGPSIFNIMIVIGLTGWTGIARLVRAEFLRLAEQEFVLAGRALGYSPWRIIFKHVLPNALAPVMVSATFGIAGAILTESGLSFLGFGITVPTPSWGGILSSGRVTIFSAPWLIYFPGTAIFVTITAYNLVGEALRDAADPRLRN